jgi:circadian clock protein KaiC
VIERLRTGVRGLDEVLGSGLPVDAINLILGLPGTGKTLLAQELMFHNATADRPALYLSTVSEPFDKIIRYGQQLTFFDPDAVGKRVFYEDLGGALLEGKLDSVGERVRRLLERYEPGLVVIDSFRPLRAFAESDTEYRRFLHALAARLSVRSVTSVWVGEYSTSDLVNAPEFAVADGVIWLASTRYEEREMRLLQVLKLRGSDYLSGRHAYRLSADGLRVFPRLADPGTSGRYDLELRSVSTGVDTLDRILGGGYQPGSATLVVGPSGIGKTVFGLHFVCAAGGRGETSVLAAFEENPSQLARAAASFGWSLEESEVRLMYRSAVDLYVDEWVYELLEAVESSKAARVFIDGVASLRAASPDPTRFKEYLYSLVQRCSRQGTTLMMSLESPELFGVTRVSETAISQMADNVVLLHFVRREGEYRRAMTFFKSRATAIPLRTWEYTISSNGIALVRHDHGRRRA